MRGELRRELDRVGRRIRRARLLAVLSACWLVWGFVGLALWRFAPTAGMLGSLGWRLPAYGVCLALLSAAGLALLVLRSARDRRWLARRIESRHHELAAGLLAAVDIDSKAGAAPLGFLDASVVRAAVEHAESHDWASVVPRWAIPGAQVLHLASLFLLIGAAGLLLARTRSSEFLAVAGRNPEGTVQVEPGDVELERGTPLLVVARFHENVPAEASLMIEGDESPPRPMVRSLEDPTFAVRLDSVEADLAYRVAFGHDQSTPVYRVKVFEHPEVVRTDARLDFPTYTRLAPKKVEDIRHVTAVEGTSVTLDFRLNKEVASARLVDEQGPPLPLLPSGGGDRVYSTSTTMADPRKLRVELIDKDGRVNKWTTVITLNVTPNTPPVIKASRPARDVRVSPIEELALAARITDDFGILRHGLTFSLGGDAPRDLELGDGSDPARKVDVAHLLAFETLGVEPDDLATYFFWAEDVGPDGQPRRTSGDLYFAEVRPFDEIFREGDPSEAQSARQQQQQQQAGNGQQAAQLAELQKQIINATWSLMRRESGSKISDKLAEDAAVVRQSQAQAIQQAEALGEALQDPASTAHLDRALTHMQEAQQSLGASADGPTAQPLPAALAAEQAAYQSLLKLRDREFEVVRGQSGPSGASASARSGPSQRQLQQLELSNQENRYEQRRAADGTSPADQDPAQRELRQVMNRLRELAQRQQDLNERLRELQAALQAASEEQTRQELQRQLKRLREQQQEILRDTDELQQRMEQDENRERMAEARQQVEQSREHIRQASEALDEARISQAITEGTRANRQLDQLREELRKQSSNQFSEELTSMRDQARTLAETQRALTDRLESPNRHPAPSLRTENSGDPERQALDAQRQKLDQLQQRIRSTVQQAEETEPLLASDLFDTSRKAEQAGIDKSLDAARRLADLGVAQEAARASRQAAEGLDELRKGVERAAERVLGDQTAALRLARGELEDLADAIDRELAQANAGQRSTESTQTDLAEQTAPSGRDPASRSPGEPNDQTAAAHGGGNDQDQGRAEPRQRARQQDESADGQPSSARPSQPQSPTNQERQPGPGENRGQSDEPRERPPGGGQGPGQTQRGLEPTEAAPQPPPQPPQAGTGRSENPTNPSRPDGSRNNRQEGGQAGSELERLLSTEGSLSGGPRGPITGDGFREWSDRMRDVEELLDNPDLQAEAARIRDRVRATREDFRRHAKQPDWKKLNQLVAEPLRELRDRVAEELRRRDAPDALVPIDRDPVPRPYAEGVRRYYERLGSGQ